MAEVKVVFAKQELAEKYEINTDTDINIEIPGKYQGPISKITNESLIEGMLSRKSNLVSAKKKTGATSAAPSKGTEATK